MRVRTQSAGTSEQRKQTGGLSEWRCFYFGAARAFDA